jgi:hypothetical protein
MTWNLRDTSWSIAPPAIDSSPIATNFIDFPAEVSLSAPWSLSWFPHGGNLWDQRHSGRPTSGVWNSALWDRERVRYWVGGLRVRISRIGMRWIVNPEPKHSGNVPPRSTVGSRLLRPVDSSQFRSKYTTTTLFTFREKRRTDPTSHRHPLQRLIIEMESCHHSTIHNTSAMFVYWNVKDWRTLSHVFCMLTWSQKIFDARNLWS